MQSVLDWLPQRQNQVTGSDVGNGVGLPGESLGVCGQTGGVPSVVAGELSAQVVGGDTLAEGTCSSKRDQRVSLLDFDAIGETADEQAEPATET